MEIFELNNKLDVLLKAEAERIYSILFDLYIKKTKVNKNFDVLFNEIIHDKFRPYSNEIQHLVISLIPVDLMLCPNSEWVFVSEENFDNYFNEKKLKKFKKNEKLIVKLLNENIDTTDI